MPAKPLEARVSKFLGNLFLAARCGRQIKPLLPQDAAKRRGRVAPKWKAIAATHGKGGSLRLEGHREPQSYAPLQFHSPGKRQNVAGSGKLHLGKDCSSRYFNVEMLWQMNE